MSHKICMRNVQRDGFIAELLALIENPDVESKEQQETLERKIECYTRKVSSTCPMCDRVFGFGDALCNCAPQVVEKPGPDGKPVKVMRVTGLSNRHMLRVQIRVAGARRLRKDKRDTRWHNIFKAKKGTVQLSPAEYHRADRVRIAEERARRQSAAS